MGDNERHYATHHGREYTPSERTPDEDRVRLAATAPSTSNITVAEFDRFIAKIKAEAKAEAWDEGAEAEAEASCRIPRCGDCVGCTADVENPYKETA
jgi:hypothetical protein